MVRTGALVPESSLSSVTGWLAVVAELVSGCGCIRPSGVKTSEAGCGDCDLELGTVAC